MELLVAIGSLSLAAGIAGIASILVSRKGATPSHRWACVAGIASLVSQPVLLVGLGGLMAQFLFASLASPAGIAFIVGCVAALVSTIASAVFVVRLRPRPDSASKPTPPRAA